MTNFELATHIPLIIRAPWKAASVNQSTKVSTEPNVQCCHLCLNVGVAEDPSTRYLIPSSGIIVSQ